MKADYHEPTRQRSGGNYDKKDECKLTPLALTSLGAIDDFYDLYAEAQRIYAIVWNEQLGVQGGTSNNYFPEFWDRDARKGHQCFLGMKIAYITSFGHDLGAKGGANAKHPHY